MLRPAAILLALAPALPALAQDAMREQVRFPTGSDHVEIADTITGFQSREYLLDARKAQVLAVRLESEAAATITVVAPDGSPLFNGMMAEGRSFEGSLPLSGDTRVRVFLLGEDAQAGRTAQFHLYVRITG